MRRVQVILATLGLALGVWLSAASAAWGNTITPMCTTDQGGQQPCHVGWYTSPVLLSWTWSPLQGSSPGSSCETQQLYSSDTNKTATCDVSWASPPSLSYPYTIRVETSDPTVTSAPTRPPDANGWYNRPVTIAFSGSSFSGIASCTTASYAGPATGSARVNGSCTDNAGKTAEATSASFAYDAIPPRSR